jgi:hypothetical protein
MMNAPFLLAVLCFSHLANAVDGEVMAPRPVDADRPPRLATPPADVPRWGVVCAPRSIDWTRACRSCNVDVSGRVGRLICKGGKCEWNCLLLGHSFSSTGLSLALIMLVLASSPTVPHRPILGSPPALVAGRVREMAEVRHRLEPRLAASALGCPVHRPTEHVSDWGQERAV